MAAFAQSFGQTLGRAGSDYGSAVDANLNTALAVIQNKLTMQELQQQIRVQDQRMQAEALRMKQMQVPTPVGTFQTPQGIYGATFDPNKGTYGGGMLPGSEQFFAPPPELSPEAVNRFVQTLPDYIDKAGTEQTINGYVHQGMFKEAFALMGKGAEMRPTGSAQSLEQAKQFATESGYTPYSREWYDAVKVFWHPALAGRKGSSTDPYGQTTSTESQRPLPTPQNAPQNVPQIVPQGTIQATQPQFAPPPILNPVSLPSTGEGFPYPTGDLPPMRSDLEPTALPSAGEGIGYPADLPPMRSELQIPTATPPRRTSAAPTAAPRAVPTPPPSAPPAVQAPSGAPPAAAEGKLPLDENFHIPMRDAVKLNKNLVVAANNLLDGMALKDLKIPAKDVGGAMDLAQKYGWSQGKFTPKELMMVQQSAYLLGLAKNSPALKVLDKDLLSRARVNKVLHPPKDPGLIAGTVATAVAGNLTRDEQDFVDLYNQMVGRISGLSQLVRSGRPTESQIERLKNELPNPQNSANSANARRKIDLIMNEISIAMQKGTWQGVEIGSSTATELSPKAKEYLHQQGIPVP